MCPAACEGRSASAVDADGSLVDALARWHFAASGEGLTPWDSLPEAERRRFELAARQTLTAIRLAGYVVSRSEQAAEDAPPAGGPAGSASPAACRQEAERLLRSGEPLLAYNVVQQGLESWPADLRLRQLQSLALARSGAVQRANAGLQALRDEGHADPETLALLARTHKDLGIAAALAVTRDAHLKAAFELYQEAYLRASREGKTADAYYTGINAATLALLRGDDERAREIARRVRWLCEDELARASDDGASYWLHATLAESALVLRDLSLARAQYAAAARVAGSRHGDLASTLRQARLLLGRLGEDDSWLGSVLCIPPVLVCTGHRVSPREDGVFPPSLEPAVRDEVGARLDRLRPLAVYASAACGADILCLEAMLERGGEVHVVLPFPPAEFRPLSVDNAPGEWGQRFEHVLASAASVVVASDHVCQDNSSGFEYANLIMTGAGRLRAQVLGTSLVGLAVWDGGPARGRGGTADVVELWRARQLQVEHVDVAALRCARAGQAGPAPASVSAASGAATGLGLRHEIKSMLFADAVGYSKLSEDQIPTFVEQFLGAVARLNERTRHPPIHMQTAGDGLYFVFAGAADAGHYALELNQFVRTTDWPRLGLPPSFDLRIGLHCGPIFCGQDPVTKLPLYTGSHTSRTARIEPITPPGQVYASAAFAAVAAASGVDDLDFSYIGRIPLAKKYGSLALYHVQKPRR